MLSKKVEAALNDQLNLELASAYIYAAMAAYCDGEGLKGFAHWMREQAKEEVGHAMRFYNHIYDMQGRVILDAVPKPPEKFPSVLAVCKKVLEHERKVTKSIHQIVELAAKENDPATGVFLQWFVTEQVEEEVQSAELVAKVEMVGDNKVGLYMLDKELGARS